ncbi:hypothetical protein AB3515_09050 [Acinetobacter baumannii]
MVSSVPMGLILGIKSAEFNQLISNLTDIMGAKPAQTMLNAGTLKAIPLVLST